jgi:Co/Zn/Cd efflux system component
MTNKSIFHIAKMDCSSEEQLIKMKLDSLDGIESLEFNIPNRKLTAYYNGQVEPILNALESLNLNTKLISTEQSELILENEAQGKERKLLWIVLIINVSFFVIEITTGFLANSMGLLADSLDMLADGIVYGLALFAVGGTVSRKKNIAKFAGYFQIILATIGFSEVIRRFIGFEKMPDFQLMITVSFFALIANVICLYLLQKGKSNEAHMQASMIFTSNDIIINSGVITAGLLVNWLNSSYPDLIIGAAVFIIVARGAYRILQLAK